jgi:choline dehydrogenase
VIVGAGSAGCVLANRLSEDPAARVLLLEAGGRGRHPNVRIPAAFSKQFRTKLDWAFDSEPEPGCDGRSLFIPRGKSLGGSSSMNAMVYMRGRPIDFDAWRDAGCEGWGWDDVLPYFKRSENNSRGPSELHGTGGPLEITDQVLPNPVTERIVDAAEAVGIPKNPDFNSPEQDGVGLNQVTQKGGRRWSAADAYLPRAVRRRRNLRIVTGAQALGLVFDGDRAAGVRYRDAKGREHVARASREVILAAGAIGSPWLLQLSGIGPADHLREVGIEPRAELPGVGENLQDHPYIVCVWESELGGTLLDAEKPRELLNFLFRKSGLLTSNVAEGSLFTRTRPGLPAADLQFHFGPVFFVDHGFTTHDRHAFSIVPILVTPKSRGHVRLKSADPLAKPAILGNHLTEPEDIATLVAGVKLARRVAVAEPLAEVTGRELFPGPDVEDDDEAIEADIRRRVELTYHPVGTCRMGVGDDAVVDPELRVRGVEGLRVADASVMPLIPGGNTHASVVMIGEKASDLIKRNAGSSADASGAGFLA